MFSASLTFKEAQEQGKAVVVYHLADYDPSGHAAADAIEETFEEDFDCPINFERIAILPEHIAEFNLPTRPVKESDSRSRTWEGSECVELDSMPPAELRGLVEDAITSQIDAQAWEAIKKVEAEELRTFDETLAKISATGLVQQRRKRGRRKR
jgi:hypothetical protein